MKRTLSVLLSLALLLSLLGCGRRESRGPSLPEEPSRAEPSGEPSLPEESREPEEGEPGILYPYPKVGLENFRRERSFTDCGFTDISDSPYYENIVAVYEFDLMDGVQEDLFDPQAAVTYAEAAKYLVCLHSIYYEGQFPPLPSVKGAGPYAPYLLSGQNRGLLPRELPETDAPMTRAQFCRLLAGAISSVDLPPVNFVDPGAIPDVGMESGYAREVYLLFRAGVLTGSGEEGAFYPDRPITRAEAAAVISRMVDPSLRQRVEYAAQY